MELKAYHVTRALGDPRWNNNTKTTSSSQSNVRFNWGVDEELRALAFGQSQEAAAQSPGNGGQPREYATIVRTVEEPCFRDLIEIAWETGARVQELRKLEAAGSTCRTAALSCRPAKSRGRRTTGSST